MDDEENNIEKPVDRLREQKDVKNWYGIIINTTLDSFWCTDSKGVFLDVNNAFCKLVGYSRDELLILSLYDIDESKAFEETIIHIPRIIENESNRYETKYRRKNGAGIDVVVSVSYYSLPDAGGHFFAFVRDITEAKKRENLLKENEERFRLLFEKSHDPLLLFEKGTCIDCNDAALKIMGCQGKEQIIGLGLSKMSPKKQPDGQLSTLKAVEIFQEVMNNEKKRFEWFCRSMNNEEFWVDITCTVISSEGKQVICTAWRDMTKERIIEERLKESEEKFKIFSLSGHDGIVLMDNEGSINSINKSAEKILGYIEEEVLRKPIDTYLASGNFYDAQKLQIGLAEAMPNIKTTKEERAGKALELIATRKDGREIVVELSLFSEVVADKLRLIGIFRDITERKKTLDALQRSEEKYRRLFEETKDVVFLSTPGGRFIDINKAGLELFGYGSKEEILKISIPRDLYWGPDDRKGFKEAIERQGFVNMYEMIVRKKDGQKVIVSVTANTVYDDVGNIATYQGIMRDLTEIKRLEGLLFEFQKLDAVGGVIGEIAHTFNNILSIIMGNAQLAKISGACVGDVPVYLSSIENEVFRAADMVEQLLVFGRRAQFNVNIADVNDVVRDFAKIMHENIGDNVEIRTVFTSKLSRAKIDVARINQVLLNLALNARDAMSGKGTLTIEVDSDEITEVQNGVIFDTRPGKYVVLSVSDTGIGIDEETIKKIFEPFFTTHPSGERKGLSLSVVYGIVKQHGGFIDVSSKPHQGTRFQVYLPAVLERKKLEKLSEKEIKGSNETILIAEDEIALRDIAAMMLSTLGYKVHPVADGLEAVEVFREKSDEIDIVVLDVSMPGMNGREAYREMQQIKAATPVLFMTGHSLDGIQASFILEEGFDVIQKPFTLVSLGRRIGEVLHHNRKGQGSTDPPAGESGTLI
jgi:two-component system cell cycle sensor histidine kinase/response regulator CckA